MPLLTIYIIVVITDLVILSNIQLRINNDIALPTRLIVYLSAQTLLDLVPYRKKGP